jgi:hypothetical protein
MVSPTTSGPSRRWRLVQLAEIWPPYDPAGSVITSTTPVPQDTVHQIEEQGFTVLKEAPEHAPYTHIVTTGTHDYLALLEAAE